MDAVRALVRTYLFQDLSPAEVEGLAGAARTRHLRRGQHAFVAGDSAEELWVVVSGQIKEYVVSRDGQQYISDVHGAGAVFGEPALFAPERTRVANEVAMEETVVLTVDRNRLFNFLLQHPPAMLRMLEGLSADTRNVIEDVLGLAHAHVGQRVITKLVQLCETHGVAAGSGLRIDLRLSQSVLAGMVGATRENVNRALSPMIAAGYLQLDRGQILVADIDELRRVAFLDHPLLHRRNRRSDSADE
jgi:CRP-like cAMP-binding protein